MISVFAGPDSPGTWKGKVIRMAKITGTGIIGLTLALTMAACSVPTVTPAASSGTVTGTPAVTATKAPKAVKVRYVTVGAGSGLKVRETASSDAKELAVAAHGAKVTVLESGATWSKVELSNGVVGYVASKYLAQAAPTPAPTVRPAPTADPALKAVNKPGYIASKKLTVRKEANNTSKPIAELKQKTKVTVLEVNGAWSKVKLEDGTVGYVATKYCIVPQRAPKPEDWSYINPDMPAVLYTYDLNLNPSKGRELWYDDDYKDNPDPTQTNKDLLPKMAKWYEQRGDPVNSIDEILKFARDFVETAETVDFRSIGADYRKDLLYFFAGGGGADRNWVDPWIARVKRDKIVAEAFFVTDKSLVYRSRGATRVRGREYIKYGADCGREYLEKKGVKPDTWYYYDYEVFFGGAIGNDAWEYGTFAYSNQVNLSDLSLADPAEVEVHLNARIK